VSPNLYTVLIRIRCHSFSSINRATEQWTKGRRWCWRLSVAHPCFI